METATKRKRFANGPARPKYLTGLDADRAVMMILALAAEVSALRERLDTHERLAEEQQLPRHAAVEGYAPDEAVEVERATARRALIDRVTRVLLEPETARVSAADQQNPGMTQDPQ